MREIRLGVMGRSKKEPDYLKENNYRRESYNDFSHILGGRYEVDGHSLTLEYDKKKEEIIGITYGDKKSNNFAKDYVYSSIKAMSCNRFQIYANRKESIVRLQDSSKTYEKEMKFLAKVLTPIYTNKDEQEKLKGKMNKFSGLERELRINMINDHNKKNKKRLIKYEDGKIRKVFFN